MHWVSDRLKSRSYPTQSGETRFYKDINLAEVQTLGQRSSPGQFPGQFRGAPSADGRPGNLKFHASNRFRLGGQPSSRQGVLASVEIYPPSAARRRAIGSRWTSQVKPAQIRPMVAASQTRRSGALHCSTRRAQFAGRLPIPALFSRLSIVPELRDATPVEIPGKICGTVHQSWFPGWSGPGPHLPV